MTLIVSIGLMQSCRQPNYSVARTCKKASTTYIYADEYSSSKIILYSTGDFAYNESSNGMLIEICQYIKGSWHQKKDTAYLTTLYQGNYITELEGSVSNDSVLIFFYSIQTGEPTDDFAYINEKDSIEFPTTDGLLFISCTEKESLTRQLLVGLDTDDGIREKGLSLECGRAYKCYMKDCHPIVMRERKFILTDSSLLDLSVNRLYHVEDLP